MPCDGFSTTNQALAQTSIANCVKRSDRAMLELLAEHCQTRSETNTENAEDIQRFWQDVAKQAAVYNQTDLLRWTTAQRVTLEPCKLAFEAAHAGHAELLREYLTISQPDTTAVEWHNVCLIARRWPKVLQVLRDVGCPFARDHAQS